MEIVNLIDLVLDSAAGQRLAALRREWRQEIDVALAELVKAANDAADAYGESRDKSLQQQRAALRTLVSATDRWTTVSDFLAQTASLDRRVQAIAPSVIEALEHIVEIGRLPLPAEVIPESVQDAIASVSRPEVDGARTATRMLRLESPAAPTSAVGELARIAKLRLWAMHTLLLTEIAATNPTLDPLEAGELKTVEKTVSEQMRDLRDAARGQANALRQGVLTPGIALKLNSALLSTETWLLNEGVTLCAQVLARARARVDADASDADTWARAGAAIYDDLRTILSLDAGIRRVLGAHSSEELSLLEDFADAAPRPVGSAVPDLPRTEVSDVGELSAGSEVEVAGIIRDAQFVSGGPSPRSVLELREGSVTVRLLVPFSSIDSFGILPGVWVQIRGETFPAGKDDLPGPVVQVRRIRREEAAAESFFDWLVFSGRALFELRPGGFDILGGRLAGDLRTILESGLRRWLE
jgi:hypothetical protein